MFSAAAIKVVPLSEIIRDSSERRAVNLRKARKKASTDMSRTSSRCTARVTAQVNSVMYALFVVADCKLWLQSSRHAGSGGVIGAW